MQLREEKKWEKFNQTNNKTPELFEIETRNAFNQIEHFQICYTELHLSVK